MRLRSCVPIAELVEADVRVERKRHEENERSIEEDEPRLEDMRIVYRPHSISSPARPPSFQDSPMRTRDADSTPTIQG